MNRKNRVPIPDDVASEVLFVHRRTCCVCNISGRAIQIHHIDEDPSNNDPSNLSVLCLQCHDDTQLRGGFGRKLLATEVIKYRDDWVRRVAERKAQADAIVVQQMAPSLPAPFPVDREWEAPSTPALTALINSLPPTLRAVYDQARPLWDSAVTLNMIEGSWLVIDVLERAWIELAKWYPPNHFGNVSAEQFFRDYIRNRQIWNLALKEPDGFGSAGREAVIIACGDTMQDVEGAVVETVRWLADFRCPDIEFVGWKKNWDAAQTDVQRAEPFLARVYRILAALKG